MNELRSLVQSTLEEIQDIEVSAELPDEVIEENKTYFSYSLRRNFVSSDNDANFVYKVVIDGFIKRKVNLTEDTLKILDDAQDELEKAFKKINAKTSFEDVSVLDNIKKIRVTGNMQYYELNKGLL